MLRFRIDPDGAARRMRTGALELHLAEPTITLAELNLDHGGAMVIKSRQPVQASFPRRADGVVVVPIDDEVPQVKPLFSLACQPVSGRVGPNKSIPYSRELMTS